MIVYRDGKGTMHAVEGESAIRMVEKSSRDGKWREIDGACSGGFPVVLSKTVVAEVNGNVFIGDNGRKDKPLNKCDADMRRAVREFLIVAGV